MDFHSADTVNEQEKPTAGNKPLKIKQQLSWLLSCRVSNFGSERWPVTFHSPPHPGEHQYQRASARGNKKKRHLLEGIPSNKKQGECCHTTTHGSFVTWLLFTSPDSIYSVNTYSLWVYWARRRGGSDQNRVSPLTCPSAGSRQPTAQYTCDIMTINMLRRRGVWCYEKGGLKVRELRTRTEIGRKAGEKQCITVLHISFLVSWEREWTMI